jgi:hypothetical protein
VYEVEAELGALMGEPRRGLTVDPEASVFLTFQLQEGGSVEGTVVDARTGRPIAGAEVTVGAGPLAASPRMTLTGGDGRFAARPFPEGPVSVDVRASGYVPAIATGCRTGAPCRIALAEGASLRGRVVDADARPVVDAWVEVLGEARDRSPIAVTSTATPIASLLFAPTPPPTGETTLLPSTDPAALAGELTGAGLGVTAEVPPLPLVAAGSAGEVDDPLAPAPVASRSRTTLRTDAFGEFVVTGLPPGRVEVLARAPGFRVGRSARLSVAAGAAREGIEIVLRPGATIHARVLDERGRAADAQIEARVEGDPVPRYVTTDARGEIVLDDVGGAVLLAVASPGHPLLEEIVEVTSGHDVSREIRLEAPTRRLRARVLDPRGDPVSDALVRVETLRPGTGQPRTLVSDANGEIELAPAPHGALLLTASHPAFVSAPPTVASSEERGGTSVAELRLEAPLALSTTVLDAWTGAAIVGASARWACLDAVPCLREVESDEDGHLALWSARAGRYRVEVRAAGYATRAFEITARAPRRGADLELDPFVLTPAMTLEGDVVDRLGLVVEDAEVTTADDDAERPSTRTDARGHFVLRSLAAGDRTIVVRHPAAGEVRIPLVVRRDRDPAAIVARLPGRADATASDDDLPARVVGVAIDVADVDGAVVVTRTLGPGALGAGLVAGDVVRAVDDIEVRDAAMARRRLEGSPFVPALLRVERGGHTLHLRVPRERHARE